LERTGLFDPDSDYGGMIGKAVMELVKVFDRQDHSGFSAQITIKILNRLLRFKPLTPLTGEPDEWIEIGTGEFQNKRSPDVFMDKRGAYTFDWEKDNRRVKIEFPYWVE
jgi:hypothetical protein